MDGAVSGASMSSARISAICACAEGANIHIVSTNAAITCFEIKLCVKVVPLCRIAEKPFGGGGHAACQVVSDYNSLAFMVGR